MNRAPRIVLIGFMGSGKTTAGRALANLLECRMVDLDEVISRGEDRSIRALIEEKGEAVFRACESVALRGVLEDGSADVISLGGGAWAMEQNRALIGDRGCCSVWLVTPFELCWQRILSNGRKQRPLRSPRSSESTEGLAE